MANLSAAVEDVACAPEAEKRPALRILKEVLDRVVAQPGAAVEWSVASLRGRQLAALPHVARALCAAGFAEQPGGLYRLAPGAADAAAVEEGVELLTILLSTMEEEPGGAAAMDVDEEVDPELAAALAMSMQPQPEGTEAKRPRQEESDEAMAARLAADNDEPEVHVEFERFRDEDVLIKDEAVKEINEFCAASGEPYVDPQFPPVSRSLYINEEDAKTWQCFVCHNRTPLPPLPKIPESMEEAQAIEDGFSKVVCGTCGEKAPNVVKVRYFNRPTQWLRPGVRCESCLANAPFEYPQARDPTVLVDLMCTHYLRSHSTRKTVGNPWKVIRDQPRPEDVVQGALGNCWFCAALSIVAAKPELVWNLFITREFNPHGAYQLQLYHGGEWRDILIDDLFPTSQVQPGKIVGEMIHYARGGNLSFMNCGRHQIWVPLVEKAAAKLAGSYGNLSSGTFGEALAMFTGFPTESLRLYISDKERQMQAEARDRKQMERTQMLLRGETPPEEDEEDLMLDENFRSDLLWSKLLSFKDAGYLMGMGCTEQGCEKTKEQILEVGLQAPHAYGILDVREVTGPDGTLLRMMQIRNPWGEGAPRTWKGAWGKDSPLWTFDMKLKLGVVNRANVEMYDTMGIFWMTFDDVKNYFAAVEVCRVHDGWEEYRERAWLPCGVGPGEAFDISVGERTQVDIALWQEKHAKRESAQGASTNIDIGFAVLRRKGENPDGTPEFECIDYIRRSLKDCISKELILDAGYTYRISPLCFNQMQEVAPRRATLAVHSSKPLALTKVSCGWRDVACAALAAASKGRCANIMRGIRTSLVQEEAGYILALENDTDNPFGFQVDSHDSIGYVSSREDGACGCIDLVPARSRKVVIALAVKQGVRQTRLLINFEGLPAEAAAWAVLTEDVHMAIPLTALSRSQERPPVDPRLAAAAPPSARPLHARGHQKVPEAAPHAAAGASPTADDDEDLAAAIALSMAAGTVVDEAPPVTASSSAAPAAAAVAVAAGDSMQSTVKDLLEKYKKQGLSANEAALKAMAEARARAAGGTAQSATPPPRQESVEALVKQLFQQYREQGMAPNAAAARAMQEAKARLSG